MDNEEDNERIDRVKLEGPVPFLDPDNCSNGWSSPPGSIFMVRGPEYFKTRAKIPGSDYLLKPIGFDWIKGPTKISEPLANPKNRVRTAIENEKRSKGFAPFIWAFNLQVPSKDNYSAVAYFVSVGPSPHDSLIDRFLKGDDGFRNSRLKMIANVVKGPWIVRKAVGEQAICIIGRALTCRYCQGENFINVDIDIGSSVVANAVVHLAFGYLRTLTVDLAFLIEGQAEEELPERILGAVRFSELDTASARQVELPGGGSDENLTLPGGFWKSLGQGLSQFIRPPNANLDSSTSSSGDEGSNHGRNNEDAGKL